MKKLKHYISMMNGNRKKYFFLSVTITMSFTLLFLYLAITDSNTYNAYKEILGTSDKIAIVFGNSDDQKANENMRLLSKYLSKEDRCYIYYEQQQILNQDGAVNAQIEFVPNAIWAHYVYSDNYINPVKFEKQNIELKENEAIVEKNLYRYLERKGDMNISIPILITKEKKIVKEFQVVGYCDAGSDELIEEEGSLSGYTYIFLAQNALGHNQIINQSINAKMLIYSQEPYALNDYAQKLGLNLFSVYNHKVEAVQSIRNSIKNKMILCIILYIILGINLYSSFKNTLSERKYEIGVKRAIGASKYDVIQQFFFEGLMVTIGNIIMSVWLSITVLLLYKWYMEFNSGNMWIVYISKYSIVIFWVVSIFLSVFYSVIFAYSTTKIDVLENLRDE